MMNMIQYTQVYIIWCALMSELFLTLHKPIQSTLSKNEYTQETIPADTHVMLSAIKTQFMYECISK